MDAKLTLPYHPGSRLHNPDRSPSPANHIDVDLPDTAWTPTTPLLTTQAAASIVPIDHLLPHTTSASTFQPPPPPRLIIPIHDPPPNLLQTNANLIPTKEGTSYPTGAHTLFPYTPPNPKLVADSLLYAYCVYQSMQLVFVETPVFTRLLGDNLTDESYRKLQRALMENPELGVVMPSTGGFRKVRWEDSCRGKGKRGGLRVIYYYLSTDQRVWLFTLYDKDESADLSNAEKKALNKAIQAELEARRRVT